MSREIYDAEGKPEGMNETLSRENIILESYGKRFPSSPEQNDALNKINFDKLRSVIFEIILKYSPNEEDLNFIPRERIFSTIPGSEYSPEINVIMLMDLGIGDQERKEKLNKIAREIYGSIDLAMLKSLAHEETHAASKNKCVGVNEEGRALELQSGIYKYKEISNIKSERVFDFLNEGIVEKLSREIFIEFLEQSSWPKEEVEIFKNTLQNRPDKLSYSDETSLLNSIIKKLAKDNKLSQEEFWGSLVRAMMKGEMLEESAIGELLRNSFGPDFLKELAHLVSTAFVGEEEKLVQFMKKYELEYSML